MGRFNLDDYAPVEERIALFYNDHPDGRIHTAVERLDPPLVVFRAEVYRDAEDGRPWATGYAYEKEGEGHVNSTSYIENCETSAIGRALANAGYHGKRDGAPRPSREEMQKVQRMGGDGAPANGNGSHAKGIACPVCGGDTWDNRADKEAGRKKQTFPDLKCKDKGCEWAVWLSTWRDDLLPRIAAVHKAELIGAEERLAAEKIAKNKDPALMVRLDARLKELELEVEKMRLGELGAAAS